MQPEDSPHPHPRSPNSDHSPSSPSPRSHPHKLSWKDFRSSLLPKSKSDLALPLKRDIMRILANVEPEAALTTNAMDILVDMLVHSTDLVLAEADTLRLTRDPPRTFVSKDDVRSALSLVFEGEFLRVMQTRSDYVLQAITEHKQQEKSKKK